MQNNLPSDGKSTQISDEVTTGETTEMAVALRPGRAGIMARTTQRLTGATLASRGTGAPGKGYAKGI